MAQVIRGIHVVGIGGTLRQHSTSLAALDRALAAAEQAGASVERLSLEELDLPMFVPGKPLDEYGPSVALLVDAARRADAMIWSSAGYHGTITGAMKNALDFMEFLSKDERPYLHGTVVGLIATAGGELASVNTINVMVQVVHALRGTVAPLFVAIPRSWEAFNRQADLLDKKWAGRLDQLGALVVETAAKFKAVGVDFSVEG